MALSERDKTIIRLTKIDSLKHISGLLDTVDNMDTLKALKLALKVSIATLEDAKTVGEAKKNLKEMFGIEL